MPPVPKKADWPNDSRPVKPNRMIEADAEQAPYQNAVDRGRREPEIGQDERRGDQSGSRQGLNEKGTLSEHRDGRTIRGRPCRAGRMDAARAPTSWPRTA